MNEKEFEGLLYRTLKPDIEPCEELNQAILEKAVKGFASNTSNQNKNGLEKQGGSRKNRGRTVGTFAKVAAAVIIFFAVGAGTVYAANIILDKVFVTDHGAYVGNEEYMDDSAFTEALSEDPEDVDVKDTGHENPGPNDKWLSKDTKLVSGLYENVSYTYGDFKTAVEDTGFPAAFKELPGEADSVIYTTINLGDDTMEYEMDTIFNYGEGKVALNQSYIEGNVAPDAAFGVATGETENERIYSNSSGAEFTLIDSRKETSEGEEEKTTYVVVSYNNVQGYLSFNGLSEDEIHQILDKVVID